MNNIKQMLIRITTHPLARGSFVTLSGSMLANIAAYVYHVVIGRLLGPIIYGEFSALMSLFYLINIGSGVLQTILAKFFTRLRAKELYGEIPTLFWASFRWIFILALMGFFVALFLSRGIGEFLHISSVHFLWLYAIFASYIFSVVNVSLIQSYQMFFASSVLTNIGSWLRIGLGVVGAPFGLLGVLIGNVLSNILTYGLYFIPIWSLLKPQKQLLSITKLDTVSYSVPAFLATLGSIALYSQDVLLVKHFFEPIEAGIYASLAVLGKIIFYASSSLGYVLFPMVAERSELKKSNTRMIFIAVGAVFSLSLLLTLGYFIFPEFIVRFMYGKAFDGAIPYMGLFGLFITFFSITSLFTTIFLALGKTRVWIITLGAALLQCIGLWVFHTTLYQVIFVNIVVCVGASIALLIYYFYGKK